MARKVQKVIEDPAKLEALRENMEKLKAKMEAMCAAYFNRTPFGDEVPEYEDVRRTTEEFIRANYEFQEGTYGKIMVKLSVAKLLR